MALPQHLFVGWSSKGVPVSPPAPYFQWDKGAGNTDILSTECTWFSHSLVSHNTDGNSQHQHQHAESWFTPEMEVSSPQATGLTVPLGWLRDEPHPNTPLSNSSTAVVPFLRIHVMQLREWAQASLKNSLQASRQLLHWMLSTVLPVNMATHHLKVIPTQSCFKGHHLGSSCTTAV